MKKHRIDMKSLMIIAVTVIFLSGCGASKVSTGPVAWSYPIEWTGNTTVQKTASGHFVIQKGDSLIVIDGLTGKILVNDVPDSEGSVFSRFASQVSEGFKEEFTLSSDNPYVRNYISMGLPSVNTLLLFNIKEDEGYIRSINTATGEQRWKTTAYRWNREKKRDELNLALSAFSIGSGSTISAIAMKSRSTASMIEALPVKDAFLFKTINKLHLVDANSGKPIWSSSDIDGTGMAAMEYLPESDQILLVGSMRGVRDAVAASSEDVAMNQVTLIDASTGHIVWQTPYTGRSATVQGMMKVGNRVYLYQLGGIAQAFAFDSGTRLMGTRDHTTTKNIKNFKSFMAQSGQNKSPYFRAATPQFEDNYVYAANTISYNATSLPDREITKMNAETGEVIWSHPLEESPKIKEIFLSARDVIVRIPKTNVLGKEKEAGLYAFSKETGALAWKVTKPFQKNMSGAYFSTNTALVNNGEKTFVVDLNNGEILKTSSYGAASDYYYPVSKNTLVSYSEEPFVVTLTKPDFSIVATDTLSTEKGGELAEWNHNYLIFKRVPMFGDVDITAYNHTTHKKAGNFSIEQERGTTYAHGLYLVDDKIVLMREEALVAYDLY